MPADGTTLSLTRAQLDKLSFVMSMITPRRGGRRDVQLEQAGNRVVVTSAASGQRWDIGPLGGLR